MGTGCSKQGPIPAAGGDSRFRIEDDGQVYCSDEALFPRETLRLRGRHNGRNLCVALAVLDGMGLDVVGERWALLVVRELVHPESAADYAVARLRNATVDLSLPAN